jgi:hypothetical protein
MIWIRAKNVIRAEYRYKINSSFKNSHDSHILVTKIIAKIIKGFTLSGD